MGATSFYGWPYPDPGSDVDVPRDIKALADELETIKTGLTVPTGDVQVGGNDTTARNFNVQRVMSSVLHTGSIALSGNNGNSVLIAVTDGTVSATYYFSKNGLLQSNIGGTYRPVPFATYGETKSLALTTAAGGTVTFNFPSGRFTVKPIVLVSVEHASNVYAPILSSSSATGCVAGARHTDGTATSSTIGVSILAIQMLPSGNPG